LAGARLAIDQLLATVAHRPALPIAGLRDRLGGAFVLLLFPLIGAAIFRVLFVLLAPLLVILLAPLAAARALCIIQCQPAQDGQRSQECQKPATAIANGQISSQGIEASCVHAKLPLTCDPLSGLHAVMHDDLCPVWELATRSASIESRIFRLAPESMDAESTP
jgi:hypothetical protein